MLITGLSGSLKAPVAAINDAASEAASLLTWLIFPSYVKRCKRGISINLAQLTLIDNHQQWQRAGMGVCIWRNKYGFAGREGPLSLATFGLSGDIWRRFFSLSVLGTAKWLQKPRCRHEVETARGGSPAKLGRLNPILAAGLAL